MLDFENFAELISLLGPTVPSQHFQIGKPERETLWSVSQLPAAVCQLHLAAGGAKYY